MTTTPLSILLRAAVPLAAALSISGCVGSGKPAVEEILGSVDVKEQTCLARAMYFESNRSSEAGMMAVGTVVMNRVESPAFPNDVCSVVAQKGQFAPGVMTREMTAGRELAMASAARILRGERHESVRQAKFFHTAGYSFSYPNMHYVAIAGGNSFYEKIDKRLRSHARLATQADVKAGRPSFDFAALDNGDAQGATSALALDQVEKPRRESPFLRLFKALSNDEVGGTGRASDGPDAP